MKKYPALILALLILILSSCTETSNNNEEVAINVKTKLTTRANYEKQSYKKPVKTFTKKEKTSIGQRKTKKAEPPITKSASNDSAPTTSLSLPSLLTASAKKPSINIIDNRSEQTIILPEGTQLKIPAHAFVYKHNGQTVQGKIEIVVKEFYHKNDFLLNNLSTMSNNQLLESGGTIHIAAIANGKACELKKDIEIAFPTKNKQSNMEIFYGVKQGENLNWIQEKKSHQQDYSYTVSKKSKLVRSEGLGLARPRMVKFWGLPGYPGGRRALNKFLRKNTTLPKGILERGQIKRIYVTFDVEENGALKNIKGGGNKSKRLEEECVRLVNMMPNFIFSPNSPGPLAQKSKAKLSIQISHTGKLVCVELNVQEASGKQAPQYLANYYKQKIDSAKSTTVISTNDVMNYTLYTSRLGWINCDKFYKDRRPKVILAVAKEPKEDVMIKLVFENMRAIMTGRQSDKHFMFRNIPVREKVTVFAIKKVKDQIYLATQKVTTGTQNVIKLDYKAVAQSKLKQEIEKLSL